jgi:DNA-binding NtrC family response regulator
MEDTVLLVDDDRSLLDSLQRLLHKQPYRILTAENADDAIDLLQTEPIDLIVCDECLPGLPGTVFLAWAAEHHPQVVRIMLTGQPSADSAIRAINQSKAFRFMVKPCDGHALATAIKEGLAHSKVFAECHAKAAIGKSAIS